jgi:hypothetical protein
MVPRAIRKLCKSKEFAGCSMRASCRCLEGRCFTGRNEGLVPKERLESHRRFRLRPAMYGMTLADQVVASSLLLSPRSR